jgi:hypothetical protein
MVMMCFPNGSAGDWRIFDLSSPGRREAARPGDPDKLKHQPLLSEIAGASPAMT